MSASPPHDLLDQLRWIAIYKSWLPFNLRGWVSSLGLHVQDKSSGSWTRLQAGGALRKYIDAWREGKGPWEVTSFNGEVWKRRFAPVVSPTLEIAEFLQERVDYFDGLDPDGAEALTAALNHHKQTGGWTPLPRLSEETKLLLQDAKQADAEAVRRVATASNMEKLEDKLRANPSAISALDNLWLGYLSLERYREAESALGRAIELNPGSYHYKTLGKLYLAALSTSTRGKGLQVSMFPRVDEPKDLNHDTEVLRDLAELNLQSAYDLDTQGGAAGEALKELELALQCCKEPSEARFAEFDRFKAI